MSGKKGRKGGKSVLNNRLNLSLDRLPNIVKALLRRLQLPPKRLRIVLHRELVVRNAVAEVKTGGNGQIGFENEGELSDETFAAGRGVGDEEAGLGGVVDLRKRV
jgi:hypothetical protein